jgi:hypothetical protein
LKQFTASISQSLRQTIIRLTEAMADITMCTGTGCDKKEHCYRHTAKACEYRQSYFCDVPINDWNNECKHFWDNGEYVLTQEDEQ